MTRHIDGVRTASRVAALAAAAAAIGMSLYHMTVAYIGMPQAEFHYPVHLLFALAVLFLGGTAAGTGHRTGWGLAADLVLLGLTVCSTAYLFLNADYLANRFVYAQPLTLQEKVLGSALILILLEAARRTIGWVLVIVTAVFLLYAHFGNWLPPPFNHRGFPVERVLEQMYMTPDGIWNVPLAVTANYIFLFVLLGALLLSSGAGNFFTDIARGLTGRMVGGPAKTSVVASAFMGMLSGSSPANVVTTGSFTIPAMKRVGYRAPFAAGVEAVASAGGQLTPPIMGSAAFLMVEFARVSYVELMGIAIIPAMLYFLAVFAMVDLEARRLGLSLLAKEDVPRVWPILKARAWLLGPIIVMLWLLIEGFTPTATGFWAIISLMVLLLVFDPENRRNAVKVFGRAMIEAPRLIVAVSVASAMGGMIAGVVLMTGLGVKMSDIILSTADGSSFIALVLTMIVAVVLGMGMPTASAYIILATLLAPGLTEMGVPLVAAHLFIIYCAAKSSITPPVAVASYAAAAIAGSDPWRTSLVAFKLGLSVFIIPYMFVYGPELLGYGTVPAVVWAVASASAGVILASVASSGWLRTDLRTHERLLVLVAALLLIYSDWITDLAGLALAGGVWAMVDFRMRRGLRAGS